MEKYRKLKVIGKGSFGYAVLVQSVVDRQTYVMKVLFNTTISHADHRRVQDGQEAEGGRY